MFDKKTKELIRSNINKITMWSIDDKATLYCVVDKYMHTQEDKEKFLSLLSKLKRDELIKQFKSISKVSVLPIRKGSDLIKVEKQAGIDIFSKTSKIEEIEKEKKNSALKLIEDLITEMQILSKYFSKELALKFPERLTRTNYKFGIKKLANLWNSSKSSVDKRVASIRQGFNFLRDKRNRKELKILEANILQNYGSARASKSCLLINEYENHKITGTEFIDQLQLELGRISGEIELSVEEINIILFGKINTITHLKQRILNRNYRDYNPDYKFSNETLNRMIRNLKRFFGDRAKNCIYMIKKYKTNNLNLKEYSKQQHNVGKPHFFSDLINLDNNKDLDALIMKAYWFGFLSADGWLTEPKHYTIGIELSRKDKDVITKLAKDIGLNPYRIKIRDFLRLKGTEMKPYSILKFRCRPMFEDLKKLNFRSSKILFKNVPLFVKNIVFKAKLTAIKCGIDWKQIPLAKIALAWLLGYYDGDGHYIGHRSGCIYSASKIFLIDIKRIFNIKNKILTHGKSGIKCEIYGHKYISKGTYRLNLGPDLIESMWNSYKDSMQRKRS